MMPFDAARQRIPAIKVAYLAGVAGKGDTICLARP
jgi:hypothetical protein